MNKLRIRKFGVLSSAKIYAVMMLVISLLISIPYGLVVIVFSLAGAGMGGGRESALVGGTGVVAGLGIMIGLPIFYAIFGFIFGAIGAFVYNILAGIIGGVEIEVENI